MSKILDDGVAAAVFLTVSLRKLEEGKFNAYEYTIAALERADEFLDSISDYNVLVSLSTYELEQLYSVVDNIQEAAIKIMMFAAASVDAKDPDAIEKLAKIQRMAGALIGKAANAKAMITVVLAFREAGIQELLLDGKLGPMNPSPIVEREIREQIEKALESGDFGDP